MLYQTKFHWDDTLRREIPGVGSHNYTHTSHRSTYWMGRLLGYVEHLVLGQDHYSHLCNLIENKNAFQWDAYRPLQWILPCHAIPPAMHTSWYAHTHHVYPFPCMSPGIMSPCHAHHSFTMHIPLSCMFPLLRYRSKTLFSRIEFNSSNVLSSRVTNCYNDIHKFS